MKKLTSHKKFLIYLNNCLLIVKTRSRLNYMKSNDMHIPDRLSRPNIFQPVCGNLVEELQLLIKVCTKF